MCLSKFYHPFNLNIKRMQTKHFVRWTWDEGESEEGNKVNYLVVANT